jgi:hypothetical protein
MQTDNVPRPREIHSNDNLLTLYLDSASVRRRTDGMYFVSFSAILPNAFSEQVRAIINEKHIRQIIDSFCQSADYYPVKSKEIKKSPKE